MNVVPYARVRNADFSSARKLKENLDAKIDCLTESDIKDVLLRQQGQSEMVCPNVFSPSQVEMASLFEK